MPKSVVLDTNAIIHFVEAYDMAKFNIVARILNNNNCYVPIEVIAEAVYILSNTFQNDRQTIAGKLKYLIAIQDNMTTNYNVVVFGLNLYASTKFDFVDCLLDGYAKIAGHSVFTFDERLGNELAEKAVVF